MLNTLCFGEKSIIFETSSYLLLNLFSCKTLLKPVQFTLQNSPQQRQQRQWRQQELQMSSGFVKQNNNFHMLYVFCTFLCRHCTTTMWKCLIWRFMEDLNKRPRIIFISLSKLERSPQKINSREIHLHWHFQPTGINATLFEKMQMHFQNDIFAVGQC